MAVNRKPRQPEQSIVISYDASEAVKLKVYLDPGSVEALRRGRPVRIYSLPDGSKNMEVDDRNGRAPEYIEIVPEIPPVSFR